MVAGLAAAVGSLWLFVRGAVKRQEEQADAQRDKLDQCEARHHEATAVMQELNRRVGRLEGVQEGVERLSRLVLDEVRRGIESKERDR